MDRYIEISLLPDPEFAPTTLMNALFQKLHRGISETGRNDIGVSFPDVEEKRRYLGERLRIHGNDAALTRLMQTEWLKGMRDHVGVRSMADVPANTAHRIVCRVQPKSNPERLRRRRMKRKNESEEQVRQAIPDKAAETVSLPYVRVRSESTEQVFPVFIDHREVRDTPVVGSFSQYGLSSTATVPWF